MGEIAATIEGGGLGPLRHADTLALELPGLGDVAALADGSGYDLVSYKLSDITAKQDGDILVAMFTLDADVQEDGEPVITEPSPSLVTFVRVDGEWKLASDAFFSK